MADGNSAKIVKAIQDCFDKLELHYEYFAKDDVFKLGISLDDCKIRSATMLIDVKDSAYVTYVYSPIGADKNSPDMLSRMSEFIVRANDKLFNGNYDLDYESGNVRYKLFAYCEDFVPTMSYVAHILLLAKESFKQYADGILSVALLGCSAEQAMKICEK